MAPPDAVVLHDFFVDRLVFSRKIGSLLETIAAKGEEGGGGIHDVAQAEVSGGNAVNLARVLTRLGTGTYLITHSDRVHQELLREGFDLSRATFSVKPLEPGLTVALEGKVGTRRVNVMLAHLGGAGEFSSALLNATDWRVMKASRIVCTLNWSANAFGTELLREIRRRMGEKKMVFLDPADMRDRILPYRSLLSASRKEHLFDWLSANEPEARITSRLLGVKKERPDQVCKEVAKALSIRFDLHTEHGSYTSDGREVQAHRVRPSVPAMLTGAGDVWNAASIHFFLTGSSDADRIELADIAAGLFVCSRDGRVPSRREVLSLLKHAGKGPGQRV
jgi:ribokinase